MGAHGWAERVVPAPAAPRTAVRVTTARRAHGIGPHPDTPGRADAGTDCRADGRADG
ncbi:hypothetical protein ACFWIJ_07460 [Streptomyces sp. NPDC127079]|uniref:hypothetical protein n=1 Tax=Streptomyces sp. NPDC127079 TaxID=3347132 RepID=UPI00364855C7